MSNIYIDSAIDFESLDVQESMEASLALVVKLKNAQNIIQIKIVLDDTIIDTFLQRLRDIDASKKFIFAEKPFKDLLCNLLQCIPTVDSQSPKQVHTNQTLSRLSFYIFTFFNTIMIQYDGTYSINNKDTTSRYYLFFSEVDTAPMQALLVSVAKEMGIPEHIHINKITEPDAEMPYFSENISKIHKYYRDNIYSLKALYADLADDFSRQAMKIYLDKNIICHCLSWRAGSVIRTDWREILLKSSSVLPALEGAPQGLIDFFHAHTFIFEQYSIPGIVEAKKDDVVIDAGAYIGDTTIYFAQKVGIHGKVYGFEIFEESVREAQKNLENNKSAAQCEMLNLALSDKPTTLYLHMGSHIPGLAVTAEFSPSAIPVETTSIDAFSKERNTPINFIKMDVEGAEMDILRGACMTIKRDKPVCAIAIYHKLDDITVIPAFLKELNPNYIFYIRCDAEPMLFAVNNEK